MKTSTFYQKSYRKVLLVTLGAILCTALSSCVFTKIITVPLRVTGAVISIVPGVGNTAHDSIDEAAETIDDIPI